jgi:CRP/FNR family cyclic AMP-dependent transcriptional regulator
MSLRNTGAVQRVALFGGLSRREAAEVARIGYERSVRAGSELTREGESAEAFYVLLDGTAHVSQNGERLATLGPGDFFGEIGLLGHSARTATVLAGDDVRLLVIPARAFRALLGRLPAVHGKVLAALVERQQRS